MKNQILVDEL